MSIDGAFEDDDIDALAAEFVLGLTPIEEQAEVRLRILRDPAFAEAVRNWQERFTRMTDDIKPQKPPRKLKANLNARLFGRGGGRGGAGGVWFWQLISFAALAFAAYISLNDLAVDTPSDPPVFATTIENAVEGVRLLAVYDPLREEVAVRRLEGGPRPGRVLEFWAIAPDAAPVSLGGLPEAEVARLPLAPALASQAGALTLAISDEPPGGSPTGAPTGDILGAGPLNEL
jgi:anti-sigma-K factor RskA